jgi:hypothetical protein
MLIMLRLYKAREMQRVIDPADLEATYWAVDPRTKPVFEHDGVMVWVSDPDHCRVEHRIRGRDLHLIESGTNVLPRARGLEILRTPGADYRWCILWTGAGCRRVPRSRPGRCGRDTESIRNDECNDSPPIARKNIVNRPFYGHAVLGAPGAVIAVRSRNVHIGVG